MLRCAGDSIMLTKLGAKYVAHRSKHQQYSYRKNGDRGIE